METAKVIEHEGFQLVLLPRSIHIDSSEVTVEMDHGKFVLTPRPAPELTTLEDVARHMRNTFPQGADFPDIARPAALAALRRFRARDTFREISDPAAWQREIRQDRPLPGREP